MDTNRAAIKLLMFIVFGGFAIPLAAAQSNSPDLRQLRISIVAEKQPLGIIFRELMQKYQIDIGFEQSSLDNGKWHFSFDTNMPAKATQRSRGNSEALLIETTIESGFKAGEYPISLQIRNGSIEDVFDAIVRQMDHYDWELRSGVVNIYPTRGRDPRFRELLDLRIKSFALSKGSTVEDIIVTLLALPEFQNFRKSHRISFFPVREGVTALIKEQYGRTVEQSMDFRDIRFRDLLNRITKIKKGGWILRIRGKTREGGDLGDLDI